jgi:hypothetical protein
MTSKRNSTPSPARPPSVRGRWLVVIAMIAAGLVGLLAVRIVGWVIVVALQPEPKAYIWLLPDEYAGWVRVDFGAPSAPSLPEEDGYRVLRVPENGIVRTSDALITSPSREQFIFERDGNRRPAQHNVTGWTVQKQESAMSGGHELSLFAFFGTEAEWKRVRPARGSDPLPGTNQAVSGTGRRNSHLRTRGDRVRQVKGPVGRSGRKGLRGHGRG